MRKLLLSFLLLFSVAGFSQDVAPTSIHIVRPKNFIGSLRKMKLTLNGIPIVLPKNSFTQIPVEQNSIKIESANKRFRKHSQALHISSNEPIYVLANFSVVHVKGWPKDVVVLQPICEACFNERKENCAEVKSK